MQDGPSLRSKVSDTEQTASPLFHVDQRRRIKLPLVRAGVFLFRYHAGRARRVPSCSWLGKTRAKNRTNLNRRARAPPEAQRFFSGSLV